MLVLHHDNGTTVGTLSKYDITAELLPLRGRGMMIPYVVI